MLILVLAAHIVCSAAPPAQTTTRLRPETIHAFEKYVAAAEKQQAHERSERFLWSDRSADRLTKLRKGEVVVENRNDNEVEVEGGLIHDWVGGVYIPGVTVSQVLRLVQDYNNHDVIYRPEVLEARTLKRDGNTFDVHMRLLKKKVIKVVLDTEHRAEYFPVDEKRWHSRSYSTRISEVEDPGKPGERILPPGDDHGFLWKLNSYWRFQERDGGVYVECQAISLTRDIPSGLGWLIEPITRNLPKESLHHTLASTRNALTK